MARFARERDAGPALPGDRADDAQRDPLGLEHRTLLDVDLEVADQVGRLAAGAGQSLRVAAEARIASANVTPSAVAPLADQRSSKQPATTLLPR